MMYKRSYILLILLFISAITFCQNSILKKETEVRFYYDKKKTITDTLFRDYDSTGRPLFGGEMMQDYFNSMRTYHLIDKLVVDSSLNKTHFILQFSDSLVIDEETTFYPDSIVYKVSQRLKNFQYDTLTYVFIPNSKRSKKMINFFARAFENPSYQRFVIKSNPLFYKACITSIYAKSEHSDSVKYFYNRVLHIRKDFSFNPDKKEWFTSQKIKYNNKFRIKKIIEKEVFNVDKKYYKTKTKYKYSKSGLLISEVYYESGDRKIDKITYYEYY